MAAANKVAKLIVGQGGFLSTPAVSNLIRKRPSPDFRDVIIFFLSSIYRVFVS
jgi:phosphoglucomutase